MSVFEIVTLKSGIKSLRSVERGETFHPVTGPALEAAVLHVEQQRLVERCKAGGKFVIWDVGFGAAANALAAIDALAHLHVEIELHSFDKTTGPIEFALRHSRDLGYFESREELLRRLLAHGHAAVAPGIAWRLHVGDFADEMKRPNVPAPHAIFYDPYSPAVNAEMWTLDHFASLRLRLDAGTPCLLTNYTRSTAVRVTLLLAGFFVGLGRGVGEKDQTTVASNDFSLLDAPLDRSWLERVRNSTNAAPLRGASYSRGRISAEDFRQLEAHRQFAIAV